MSTIKEKVEQFLGKYVMDYKDVDLNANCEKFLDEMQKGLNGEESSLLMIPTYISMDSEIPVNEPVIVIEIGRASCRERV